MRIETPAPSSQRYLFLAKHGWKILALIPLFFLLFIVFTDSVAVPYWDQWKFVPLLEKTYQGDLTFPDLWAQYNEHRIFFPKIIMLLLARLTNWNIGWELFVNLLLGAGMLLIFARQLQATEKKTGIAVSRQIIPAISLVVFSISQYANWLWGWQIQMLLNMFMVAGAVVLLADQDFSWKRLITAALMGFIATHSFANGILFWPIGLLILSVTLSNHPRRRFVLMVWAGISILALISFFYGYQMAKNTPPSVFKMPVTFICFVLKCIGNGAAPYIDGDNNRTSCIALVLGLIALIIYVWSGLTLLVRKITGLKTLMPYLALSLYTLGSAMLTGAGRLALGSDQAVASRYYLMTVPFWVSLLLQLFLLAKSRNNSPVPSLVTKIARWSLAVFIGLLLLGSISASTGAKALSVRMTCGRYGLMDLAANRPDMDYRLLIAIYPDPNFIIKNYHVMVEHHLGIFR